MKIMSRSTRCGRPCPPNPKNRSLVVPSSNLSAQSNAVDLEVLIDDASERGARGFKAVEDIAEHGCVARGLGREIGSGRPGGVEDVGGVPSSAQGRRSGVGIGRSDLKRWVIAQAAAGPAANRPALAVEPAHHRVADDPGGAGDKRDDYYHSIPILPKWPPLIS
jgi:hypothetical protein